MKRKTRKGTTVMNQGKHCIGTTGGELLGAKTKPGRFVLPLEVDLWKGSGERKGRWKQEKTGKWLGGEPMYG